MSQTASLESLYRAHAADLKSFTRRRVGAQDAEDLVQDTYLHALQYGAIHSSTYPRAYLYRIAANLSVDALRRARTRLRYAKVAPLEDASDSGNGRMAATNFEHLVELAQLLSVLGELPPRCQKAFVLYWFNDFTLLDTANQLGVATRTVERYLKQARDHLLRRTGRSGHAPNAAF